MNRTRTVIYCRVSLDKMAEKGVSLAAQESKAKAYAELYDLEVVQVVVDAGESAKQTVQRNGICLTLFGEDPTLRTSSPSASATPRRAAAQSTRLREYAIAISTSPAFVVTLPMPPLDWAMRHLKSNVLEPCRMFRS